LIRERCQQTLSVADFYDRLDELGLQYGPGFRGVRELYLGQNETLTKVSLPEGLASTQYLMHPAFLDACLHAYPLVLDGAEKTEGDRHGSYLPISLEGFHCYQDGINKAWVHTKLRSVEKDNTQVVDIQVYDDAERPVADLAGLSLRRLPLARVQSPQAGSTDDLFYRLVWRKSVRQPGRPERARAPASWILFADARGFASALAGKLEAAGHHCHIVCRGDAFARLAARAWTVNERRPQDFRELLSELTASESLHCDGVVYLWGLDAPSIDDLTLAGLKSGSEMMCRGALAILHALSEQRSTDPDGRRLWFVTTNTQKTEDQEHVDPVQACLWGLGRTAAIEYPGIWGGLIDLQVNGEQSPDIDTLATELLHPDGESQIVISAGKQRLVPRFVRQSLSDLAAQSPPVQRDATYLVTGGLGMLGRSVAKWLIGNGAKHLVLTGRKASIETAKELFSAKEINDASIEIVACDISRENDVRRLMRTIAKKFPPLKGVVNSVGVLDDGILAQLDWDRFARVFEPKVYGSWLLHEHTKSLELDFFILQSSLLSLLGSAGQANYSASNTFADSLAAHRRVVGLPATAINWSAWSGGGLATASGVRGEAMWSSLGVKFVSPDLAMESFDKLMRRDLDQIAVAIADWPTYAGKVGNPPFLAELLNGHAVLGSPKSARPNTDPANVMRVNHGGREELLSRLQQRIMAELGFVNPIDPDQPLNEAGLDSLRSVTLANNLEDEFGVLISISQLISGPTINQLADYLANLSAAVTEAGLMAAPTQNGRERFPNRVVEDTNGCAADEKSTDFGDRSLQWVHPSAGENEKMPRGIVSTNGTDAQNLAPRLLRANGASVSQGAGKWLIAPRPNPAAKARIFCFPYAGGGLVSFRAWAQLFDAAVELVAVEAPGRGTRINEPAIDDIDTFVAGLLPEMVDWLDRPSAFFGHCLGGLTMFATLHALPEACTRFIKYAFACGVKPPHLLKRRGEFEDNLAYDMMLHREFDAKLPPFAQTDEIFANIIRQFDTPAANRMLEIPKLREVLLPTIRAEFRMAYNYEYKPVELFSFPISSFVGQSDPWVSEKDSAGWGELTRGGFTNHVRGGSHFLMAEDGGYILDTINNEFAIPAIQ
jgi:surfactin synthase thioesterase subunit/NAD(P)-dependent dehydrogenase (short-subunit alcohol dehydrogenase family)/acyl carrier protein